MFPVVTGFRKEIEKKMKCVYCDNEETKVIETRENEEATRRRRECTSCEERFTTYEKPKLQGIIVRKKSGEKEPFSKEKIKKGMMKACKKRPVSEEEIDQAVDEIEQSFQKRDGKEFTTKQVGAIVLKKLQALDKVAYMRFASVYREFSDISSFESELQKIVKQT